MKVKPLRVTSWERKYDIMPNVLHQLFRWYIFDLVKEMGGRPRKRMELNLHRHQPDHNNQLMFKFDMFFRLFRSLTSLSYLCFPLFNYRIFFAHLLFSHQSKSEVKSTLSFRLTRLHISHEFTFQFNQMFVCIGR